MKKNAELTTEVKAYIKRKQGSDEIVRVIPVGLEGAVEVYELYTAFEDRPDYLGRILFDAQGYWMYDGNALAISEQDQLARFIVNYGGAV